MTLLQGFYIKGLEEELKDELAARDDTHNLNLIALTIGLDNLLMERRRGKANFSHSFSPILQPQVVFQLIPWNYNLPHPRLLLSMSPCSYTYY